MISQQEMEKMAARESLIKEHAKKLAKRYNDPSNRESILDLLCDMGRWCDANPKV